VSMGHQLKGGAVHGRPGLEEDPRVFFMCCQKEWKTGNFIFNVLLRLFPTALTNNR
jgi:hypothetical protein